MATTLKSYGTIGGYELTLQTRAIADGDYLVFGSADLGSPPPRGVAVLNLTKGTVSKDIAIIRGDDLTGSGVLAPLDKQAAIILNAFAAIGADVAPGGKA